MADLSRAPAAGPRPRSPRSTPTERAGAARDATTAAPRRRPRAGRVGRGPSPGAVHIPRGNLESRIERAAPDRAQPIVVYCAAGNRSAFAAKTLEELGYENVVYLAGGYHRLEAERLPDRQLHARSTPRAARALQPPPPDPRGRRGGPAASCSTRRSSSSAPAASARPPRSTSRPPASARSGSSTTTASTRQPPAPDRPLDRAARRAEGASRPSATIEALNPDVEVVDLPGAAHLRERRPDPRRRLGRDRRRRRQLPDALPRERRVRLARHPRRARLDLPLRGPDHGLRAARGPVLPLPLPQPPPPELAPSCAEGGVLGVLPGVDRLAAGERGAEARARHRRAARRPAAALRRARGRVHRGEAPPRPGLPGLRRAPDDHRVHRLRRVLRGPGSHA